MPSLLVPRPEGNWGSAYDVLVTPKTNIIMNKIYVQTYNGGTGPIIYRLRISDESTGQVIYDISSTEEVVDNNSKTVSPNIWRDFKDVKMSGWKTYRLSLTTITQDPSNTDNGTHGSTERFNGLSNEHLTVAAATSRKFGSPYSGQFPDWKFDYTVDDSGIFVRDTSSSKDVKSVPKPSKAQEGDILVLHIKHYNNVTVVSDHVNGFSLINKSEYSTMMYRVATKNEPASYTINMSTGTYNWLEMQIVAVANAKVVDWGELAGGSAATINVKRSKNFAVVGGISNTSSNVRSKVLSPYTEVFSYSMVSINPADTNVVVSASFWDTRAKYIVLEEKSENKIKHIGSKSWSETTSYDGVNGKCTWSVPSGVQVGDLIVVMAQSTGRIINSSIPSPAGYIKLHEKYGPASFNNGESGSATFYKVATESDINSKVTFYTPNNGSGIAFGSINVYRDAKILSSDIVNVTGFNVAVPGQQEEVVLLEQVRKEYATPQGGYTRIAKHGYTATTMHQYFYNTTTLKGSTDGENPEYTIPWVLIGYKEANEPPTKPESFTKQPVVSSINLSGDSIILEWSASTDLEENAISYEVEFYNGSAWSTMASNITATSYSAILSSLDTDKAQFRVRAVDDKGGQSEYTLGNVFTIATRLLLVQDNSVVKSFKNGVWELL
ncbi:fibronectin type III domain-containing protein [Bacillus cereus]|nr:fibronectin type III domain-containing protein [Bacillus cereus]